jgi:hypothetical protein
MGKHSKGLIIFAVLATAGLLVPGIGAELSGGHDTGPIVTAPDLNLSGTDMANSTMPSRYQTSPVPIRIEVTISETLIPGPKGEMAAGPRTIGFATDPVSLAILVVLILAASAGLWYLTKRRPEETTEKDEEEGGE